MPSHRKTDRMFTGLLLLICAMALSACATAQTESSSPFLIKDLQAIEVGASSTDTLSPHDAVNPRDGAPYRTYQVQLERDEILRISVESSDFSPGISLFAPDSTLVGATSREGYGDNRTSLIRRAPRSGTHIIIVSALSNRDFGSYKIHTEKVTETGSLSYPGEVQAHLFDNARTHPTTGAPMNTYALDFSDATALNIVMESPDFSGHLSVVDATTQQILTETSDMSGSARARLLTELPSGSYEIWTTAHQRGPDGRYTLRLEEASINRTESFAVGHPFHGFLSWNRTSIPSTMRTGDAIAVEVEEASIFSVVMRSTDFDAYLVLTDESGSLITEDDDSGGGYDARITWQLEPGNYTVWATSYAEEESGTYSLESEFLEADDTDRVELDSTLESVLLQSAEVYGPRQTPIQYYTLEVEEAVEVKLDLRSTDFDAYLVLEDESGRLLDENDDAHFGTTDAQITYSLRPGTYRIGVTSFEPDTVGSFTLEVRPAAPSGQRVELSPSLETGPLSPALRR